MAKTEMVRHEETQSPMSLRGEWDPIRRLREMMTWDPFGQMARAWPTEERHLGFVPAFEVRETNDGYVFKADLPGVKEEDIDITLTGNRLTVSGSRETETRNPSDRFYAYERSYGQFVRSFTLPEGVDGDNVRSELRDGVLSLMLPKKPEVKPRRITVKASSGTAKA